MPESSALHPAGLEAAHIATLWWWMLGSALAIWLVMLWLSYYAIYGRGKTHIRHLNAWLIIGGGALFPTTLLLILLCFGLSLLDHLLKPAPADALTIEVHGAQWWWRVRYPELALGVGDELTAAFETANEIVIPSDRPIRFLLHSEDVIHTFWVPALAGKVDMIPGRTTQLVVHPVRTGIFRGICAEYCGDSHAYMNFETHVVSSSEFQAWIENQQAPHAQPATPSAQRGLQLFHQHGCDACHAIAGSEARGVVGPNLTHYASRRTLAAGRLVRTADALRSWIQHPQHIKPGAEMPPFDSIEPAELDDIVAFLDGLK